MVNKKIINDMKYFIEQVKNEIQIQSVYLFGSYTKEHNKDYSDIDVAIVSDSFDGFFFSDSEKILKKTIHLKNKQILHGALLLSGMSI